MSESIDPKTSAAVDPVEPYIRTATEIAVRLGVLVLLLAWCLQIVAPFIGLVVWAFIVAIASTGAYERLAGWLGGRRRLAAVLFVLLALLLIIVPAVFLSETLVRGATHFADQVRAGVIALPAPPESIATWPIVGEQVYGFWHEASENLKAALHQLRPQLEAVSQWLLSAAGSAGIALLQFMAALVIAGILLSRSSGRDDAVRRLAERLAPGHGDKLVTLSEGTIRTVVQGILGVALIQAILAGLGLIAVGVPGAGLWALLVLVAAVIQFPVALVMVLPVLLVFSSESTGVAGAFLVWSLFVSLIDNVLKPILFGRGARVPTLVIFVGAIGGMLAMGIMGLFVGAVVLALGHQIVLAWLAPEEATDAVGGAT